jgi:DNA-binding NarL/FixJ family response regulator
MPAMNGSSGTVEAGGQALAAGDWPRSRELFEAALAEGGDDPQALLGLARSLWWLHDVDGAISNAERAYVRFREDSEPRAAAKVAIWLAREHAAVHGNEPVSAGWFARAQGLLADEGACVESGWLALVRAERADSAAEIATSAEVAVQMARDAGDPDLEAEALARRGYAEIALGRVVDGTAAIDEAMAAATGGEVHRLETIGSVTCTAVAAFEIAADWQRIERWGSVVESWIRDNGDVVVVGFCNACCAEIFVSSGNWGQAEQLLTEGLTALRSSGQGARCVHPAAKLAELRLMQGRLEEAEQLLAGFEDLPEAAHALASLHLARGEPTVAAAVLHRRLNRIGERSVLAAPFLALLVDVQLTQGDLDAASSTAERLAALATMSGLPRLQAAADAAAGAVALARNDARASVHLEAALAGFADQDMRLDASRTRMQLARAAAEREPEVAIEDAKVALTEFERIGAVREADAAAALLRRLGSSGRTGPRDLGLLTRRETEVLLLLGEGLSNAEIAARLYISTKTAGHHVSSILAKLHLTRRAEAAGYAIRYAAQITPADDPNERNRGQR